MTSQAFTDWLSVIVVTDDPANGGAGILALGDCKKCDGIGIVENVGTRNGSPQLESCAECNGTGTIPAANPDEVQDNGYAPCPECDAVRVVNGRTWRRLSNGHYALDEGNRSDAPNGAA
jgi:hypothetical protein